MIAAEAPSWRRFEIKKLDAIEERAGLKPSNQSFGSRSAGSELLRRAHRADRQPPSITCSRNRDGDWAYRGAGRASPRNCP